MVGSRKVRKGRKPYYVPRTRYFEGRPQRAGGGEIFDVGFLVFPRSCGTRFRVNFAPRLRAARTCGCGELRNAL
jgi:hypothetical protein